MGTLANSEDPDEMQHNAAFHQGLHCLPSSNGLTYLLNHGLIFRLQIVSHLQGQK